MTRSIARGFLGLVERPVPLHHHVCALRNMEAPFQLEAPAFNLLQFAHQIERIHHDAVADHAALAVMQDTARHEMQDILVVPDDHRVASVRAALKAHDHIRFLREEINDLALAFVAPLGAHKYGIHSVQVFLAFTFG